MNRLKMRSPHKFIHHFERQFFLCVLRFTFFAGDFSHQQWQYAKVEIKLSRFVFHRMHHKYHMKILLNQLVWIACWLCCLLDLLAPASILSFNVCRYRSSVCRNVEMQLLTHINKCDQPDDHNCSTIFRFYFFSCVFKHRCVSM